MNDPKNPFLLNNRLAAFTASVMGNPEYHKATKNVVHATDDRKKGLARLNSFHAAADEKRIIKQMRSWEKTQGNSGK